MTHINTKKTKDEIQNFVEKKGGKCLSNHYNNAHTKIKWQCDRGHKWFATWNDIQQGNWCPVCAKENKKFKWSNQFGDSSQFQKKELDNLKNLARNKGGKCLSEKYFNARTKLKWECEKGHVWEATPSRIKYGRWCPVCGRKKAIDNRTGKTARGTLKEMQEIAKQRGGKCLSEKYINATTKLIWQCKEGHIWKSSPFSIKREKTWCPICSQGIGERICKKYFEKIFQEKFPKRRPSWLISSSGEKMELDGFCKKLNLAFEYNGIQHYENIEYFKKEGKEYLKKRIKDDKLKLKLCQERNITLIVVPYTVSFENMGKYIIKKAKEKGISIPQISSELNYKLWDIYSPEKIKEMQEIAKQRGGECLSKNYINNSTKLKWQCSEGHVWEAKPYNILLGKWCPFCGIENRKGSKKYSIEELKNIAKEKGGKLLSDSFSSTKDKYWWQCSNGHAFKTTAYSIMYGDTWCPVCSIEKTKEGLKKYGINDMNEFARNKGGKCLSKKFINSKTKLKWQCSKGHVWGAKWSHVKEGSWCPKCSKQKK